MIISKTPYRISFFGGGTDFPEWFKENGGAVISTTIDKYCYISVRHLPPFFDHKYRIVYSEIELVKKFDEIRHPSARECLRLLNITEGVEIHHDGDLPSRSGLGSSSAFTVGLLNALKALRGNMFDKKALADTAIQVDRAMIGEIGGIQDQISCAVGGFNTIVFHQSGDYTIEPIIVAPRVRAELQNGLLLFFTGKSRTAETIEREKIQVMNENAKSYRALRELVTEASRLLTSRNFVISDFGKLLKHSWIEKKSLSKAVTNTSIDELIDKAYQSGALGCKILGAGAGGFLLVCTEPYNRTRLIESLYPLVHVPFKFETAGSQISLYDPQ